jgi:hypothetical protein
MAKMNNRKQVQGTPTPHSGAPHLPGPGGPSGMPAAPASMAHGAPPMGKHGMGNMGQPLHHHAGAHDGGAPGGGDEVGMFHQM